MGPHVSQEAPRVGVALGPEARERQPAPRGQGWLGALSSDFLASVVVFLVAVPLCLGIANACGVPPALGLITGIVGGLVVGVLAGSPLQVSGPAAGLFVVVLDIVKNEKLGLAMLGVIVLCAGTLQLLAGIGRLGQWFRAVSPAVVEGMLAGIGVLIFASQFHVMLDDKSRDSGLKNILSLPEAVQKVFIPSGSSLHAETIDRGGVGGLTRHQEAAVIGVLTIIVLVGWKLLGPKKLKVLPAPLLAILVGTGTCIALGWSLIRVDIPSDLTEVLPWKSWEDLARVSEWSIWQNLTRVAEPVVVTAILTVAFVASAETLLCATAVDQMHQGPRTRYDKELGAQGVGNMLCGLLGSLPMTGVIVRSATNVDAGAKTRLSTILHGGWLLLTVLFLAFVLEEVPTACLAAVLVYTGFKLVNLKVVRELSHFGWGEVAIYLCTLAGVVLVGLLEGVLLGVALSVIKLLYRFSHLEVDLDADPGHNRAVLRLRGAATFLRLPRLAAALEQVPPAAELHVQFEGLTYIDHACLELLMSWEKQHESLGGSLVIDWETLHGRFRTGPNGHNGHANAG